MSVELRIDSLAKQAQREVKMGPGRPTGIARKRNCLTSPHTVHLAGVRALQMAVHRLDAQAVIDANVVAGYSVRDDSANLTVKNSKERRIRGHGNVDAIVESTCA